MVTDEQGEIDVLDLSIERNRRTATTEAWRAISRAGDALCGALGDGREQDAQALLDEIMEAIWDDEEASGDDERYAFEEDLAESPEETAKQFFIRVLTVCCAYAIQAIREEMAGNTSVAWSLVTDASYWAGTLGFLSASAADKESAIKGLAAKLAAKGAEAKLKNDPKQAQKQFVFGCWKEWQKNSSRYKGKAAFARDMLEKCQDLESTAVIEKWCREWEKKHHLAG